MKISNFFKHLHLVNKHRWLVFVHCTKCGLFWRGLVHDLSKYSPTEFFESVKYYNGKKSPLRVCREDKGYSEAWLHHKGRNKHHIEYWVDRQNKKQISMPYKYAVECVCDKIAATKAYNKKNYKPEMVLDYFINVENNSYYNEEMQNFLITVFTDLKNYGERKVLNKKYMKKTYNSLVLKQGN